MKGCHFVLLFCVSANLGCFVPFPHDTILSPGARGRIVDGSSNLSLARARIVRYLVSSRQRGLAAWQGDAAKRDDAPACQVHPLQPDLITSGHTNEETESDTSGSFIMDPVATTRAGFDVAPGTPRVPVLVISAHGFVPVMVLLNNEKYEEWESCLTPIKLYRRS